MSDNHFDEDSSASKFQPGLLKRPVPVTDPHPRHSEFVANVLRTVTTGEMLSFGDGRPEGNAEDARRIPAASISEGLWKARDLTTPRDFSLHGALIDGLLNLSSLRLPIALNFIECAFGGEVWLPQAEVDSVSLYDCHLGSDGSDGSDGSAASIFADRVRTRNGNFSLQNVVAPKGVRLMAAQVDGQLVIMDSTLGEDAMGWSLEADGLQLSGDIWIERSSFAAGLNALHMDLGGRVRVAASSIKGCLDLTGARVRGDLMFRDQVECSGLIVADSTFEQSLVIEATTFRAMHDDDAGFIDARGAQIRGRLQFGKKVEVEHVIMLQGVRLGGNADFVELNVGAVGEMSLQADRMVVSGSLTFKETSFLGCILLSFAQIEGALTFESVKIGRMSDSADKLSGLSLVATKLHIGGELELTNVTSSGALALVGATVDGSMQVRQVGTTGTNSEGVSLLFDRAHIDATLRVLDSQFQGAVRGMSSFAGSQIRIESTMCLESDLEGNSVILSRARVSNGLRVSHVAIAGGIMLDGAAGGGEWFVSASRCLGGRVFDLLGLPIDATRLEIEGELIVDTGGAFAGGKLDLLGIEVPNVEVDAYQRFEVASVEQAAEIVAQHEASQLENPRLQILQFEIPPTEQIEWSGIVLESKTSDSPLPVAVILGPECAPANFTQLRCTGRLTVNGLGMTLSLDGAHVGQLIAASDAGAFPGLTSAADVSIGSVSGVLLDRGTLVDWIDGASYSPSTWAAFSSALAQSGREGDARWLAHRGAQRFTRTNVTVAQQVGSRLYDWTTGLGFYPLRTFFWLVGIVLGSIGLAASAEGDFANNGVPLDGVTFDQVDRIDRAEPIRTFQDGCVVTNLGEQCFDPVSYGMRNALPFLSSGAENWEASNVGLRVCFDVLRVLGWIFSALLIAGATGLLRPRGTR